MASRVKSHKGTLKEMDMSHTDNYVGKVVEDGGEFVPCTLYTHE